MPRARKTRAQHALAGTEPQWNDDAGSESQFTRGGRPKMPDDLSEAGQAEWKRMTKQLQKRGTLTAVDSSSLEVYCRMFSRWKTAAKEAEENPTVETSWTDGAGVVQTKVVENPASKIAARLEISLRAYQREFAATPASREKAKRLAPEKKPDEFPVGSVGWYQQHYNELKTTQPAPIPAAPAPVVEPVAAEPQPDEIGFDVD